MKRLRIALFAVLALIATTLAVPATAATQQAAASEDPADVALSFVEANHADYGVSAADVADLVVTDAYASRHLGVTHVYLRQRHQGIEVVGGNIAVNVNADGSILHAAAHLVPDLAGSASGEADLEPTEAAAEGAEALGLEPTEDVVELRTTDGRTVMSNGGVTASPMEAELVWQPLDDGTMRLAWQVDIEDPSGEHWWLASIDAETGEMLVADDQVDSEDLRAVAAALARPGGSGQSLLGTSATASAMAGVADGSSYRVYPIPLESPLDGDRSLVSEPAETVASPFGWHDTDGAAGPEFTVTRGNNVHAYTDHDNDGVPDAGSDPDGGPGLDFDFPLDLTLPNPHDYSDAAVTNLFYWNNVIHDVLYGYGFDEASGNFQINNYGRGGAGDDDVRAEAQDGGGLNNANFGTPVDGFRPRMQMYLWDANAGLPNEVTVDPPSSAAGTYGASGSAFGPDLDETGVSGPLVVVDDGSADPTLGCNPLVGFPAGAVAVVDRGACNFTVKVANAQAAGAVGTIVVNNNPGTPITLGGSDPTITIPSGMIFQSDGDIIKAGLPATGTFAAGDPIVLRDGDLDAGIIIHEYGHGVSNRLTGGPGTNCLGGEQQMGEGWSDFLAVALTAMADDEGLPRGVGSYALRQDDDGRHAQGIRPTPYSVDKNVDPTTYGDIPGLAVPHGVGYAWATIMWDAFWDLVDVHGFNPDVYDDWSTGGNNLMIQLVMDGMKLQGCFPGFVDGRDGILAADTALTGGENQCVLWESFARRGLGYSAIQGDSDDRDITEAFDLPVECLSNQFRVALSGANEPGGGDEDGGGWARVQMQQNGQVCFDLRPENVAPIAAAHIHEGDHGVNGPIVVNFDVAANGLKGCVSADPALLQQIRTSPSQYYVNLHNADFPGGAVRAQLD